MTKKAESLSSKFTSVGKTLTVGLTAPLTALTTAGIKYNAAMETYQANLTTLLSGNQQAASKLLSDLKAMANTTPFETTSLVKATQVMLGFGIQLEDSQKYLKQLGDIAMGDANKLEGLTLAFSQVSSAGKLSGQDLLQMINQGFNPLNIISQKTGESIASLKERMSDGALSAQEVAQALQWATEEGGLFYGAMDKASQTTEGKLSTLKDEFNSAVGEMTKSLLPTFTKTVDKLTEIAKWFGNLSPKQQEFIVKTAKIVAGLGPAIVLIGKLITAFIKTQTIITSAVSAIKKMELATKAHNIAMKAQAVASKAVTVAMKLFNAVMNANPIFLIVTAITAVIAGLVLLYNKCEWFRNAVNSIFQTIIGAVQKVIDFFKNNWQTILLFILNPFAGIFKILYDKFEGFRNVVDTVVNSIKNFFIGLFESIKNIVTSVYDFFKNVFILIVAVVAIALEGIWNFIKPFVDKVIQGFKNVWDGIKTGIEFVKNLFLTLVQFIYNNILSPIFNFFGTVFSNIWSGILTGVEFIKGIFQMFVNFIYNNILSPIFNFFKTIWGNVWGVISGVVEKIRSAFKSIGEFIKTVFNNVKEFISNIFSTIAGVIKAPINGVISAINSVLKSLNKIKVPDWVPGLGGKKVNFSMIPKLATGTNYVAHEGLAYLHEGEAVVPKKYNPAIGGYGNGPIMVENSNVITLQVDRKTLAEVVNNYNSERKVAV